MAASSEAGRGVGSEKAIRGLGGWAALAATVVDGNGGAPTSGRTVVLEGVRITAVGPMGSTPVPEGAEVVDAEGLWITPGLVDTHVHMPGPGL